MRIFIVEDEELHLETAIMNIKRAGYELAGYCMNADEAFEKIKTTAPDVVLVDIALPGILNGITLAQKIHNELGIPHIYITSFDQDEVIKQAVATNPKAYINKPVGLGNLKAALEIAKNGNDMAEEETKPDNSKQINLLFTKIGDRLVKIPVDKIKYIKADGKNYTSIVLENKQLSCRTTIKQLQTSLPYFFLQIHRSILININFLDEINEQTQVAIIDKQELSIGRKYKKNLLSAFSRI